MNLKDFIQKYDPDFYTIRDNSFVLYEDEAYPLVSFSQETGMCIYPIKCDLGICIFKNTNLEVHTANYNPTVDPSILDFNPKFLECVKTYLRDNEGYIDEIVIIRLIDMLKVAFERMMEITLEMPLAKRAL